MTRWKTKEERTSGDDGTIIAGKSTAGWSRGGRTPEVIGGVGEEIGAGFGEEGCAAAVTFGEDDLVEEHDGGVGRGFGLAFVDEFVEAYDP